MVKIGDLELTDNEARYLAMHAHYEAQGELDARRYVSGEIDEETGAIKLRPEWATRQERHDRWEAISRALWPGVLWSEGSR